MRVKMITYKMAKTAIESYFGSCGFDKNKITTSLVRDFVEICNTDYENWIKDMLNCYFNDNNQKFSGGKFFFEER